MQRTELRLVEDCAGVGELHWRELHFAGIRYRISRFQGIAPSGLPIPGLHRIEGAVELGAVADSERLVGANLTLKLEDGRALGITLASADGRVLTLGHGPSGCQCC